MTGAWAAGSSALRQGKGAEGLWMPLAKGWGCLCRQAGLWWRSLLSALSCQGAACGSLPGRPQAAQRISGCVERARWFAQLQQIPDFLNGLPLLVLSPQHQVQPAPIPCPDFRGSVRVLLL